MKSISLISVGALCLSSIPFYTLVFRHKRVGYGGSSPLIETTTQETHNRDYFFHCDYYSYFTNMMTNFGNNETDSTCCYVALASLLTYYDAIFNDSLVSNGRTVNGSSTESSGTLFEPYSNVTSTQVAEYYNHLRQYKNSSLHSYLVLRNKNALDSNPNTMASTLSGEFKTTMSTIVPLTNDYLTNVVGLSSSDYQIHSVSTFSGNTPNQVKSLIETEINNGRPVWCGFGGHAFIIYGHTLNEFKCHNGFNETLTDFSTLTEVSKYNFDDVLFSDIDSEAFSIEFTNYSHNHSYHYYINGAYYCICGAAQHTHSYTDHFVNLNANRHKAYCSCGDFIYEQHDYLINMFDNPCRCGRSL